MSQHEARAIEVTLGRMLARAGADAHLAAELQRARREFFGDGEAATAAQEQRFREWFLLERESELLGAVPASVQPFADDGDLDGSLAGVFLVVAGAADEVEAEDLQDGEVLDLSVPAGSLQAGDLVVGRLFPLEAGTWTPSTAAAVFRPGGVLGDAFRRDVARIELPRRLQQIELEHLLLRRADQVPSPTASDVDDAPLEHLEADLEGLLRASSSPATASSISTRLAEAERPGSVLGPVLEELAFETDIDLDAARELMLRIWNAHHAGATPRPAPRQADETLGERLVRALDEGLREKRDVEDLFAQLERMAGIEPDADDPDAALDEDAAGDESAHDDDDAADAAADGYDGDLGPLVQEYLWETGRDGEPAAAVLQQWVALQRNAPVPHTDLEQVTSGDLLRLLLHCYLRAAPDQRSGAVQQAFAELERFYAWAESTQQLTLGAVLESCRTEFVDQIDRLQQASHALSTADSGARPAFLEVEDLTAEGVGVRDDDGGHHWLPAPAATTALLRAGDLLLGALVPGPNGKSLAGLVVVLPGSARTLME
ncbi:MAG: hypothetical protein JNL08_15865 [Planctomycetes bacterium]|nr:hypothetical protein [Planctomycetota bacterium]